MSRRVTSERRGNLTAEESDAFLRMQREMAEHVREVSLPAPPRLITAVDMHLRGDRGIAVAVSVTYPELETVETRVASGEVTFPYIPGLLSFREEPLCLEAIQSLKDPPDLILVDGQGRAHPRRCGIACHLGVELQLPAIGVAKSKLTGRFEEPGEERGSTSLLRSRRETVGMVVRTRTGVSPLFVSVGNLITLDEAVEWTLKTATRYRLPEPSRRAHRTAQDLARQSQQ